MTTTHRGHGHFLARGADPVRAMAELFGKSIGYSKGRGGSQMMMDPEIGFYGSNGITGGSIPFATGVALDASIRKSDRVTACMFGDGASNQGVFHETLNMAALWKLPVLYIVENNGYAMSTATTRGLANPCLADRAKAYNIPGVTIDGNNFEEICDCVAEYAETARNGEGPALIECLTYRLSGHSRGDPRVYRTREEEQEAWDKDPITAMAKRLVDENILKTDELEVLHKKTSEIINQAIRECEDAPLASAAEFKNSLFAEQKT